MSKKRVLITGGGGLLGQYLNAEAANKYELLTMYRTHAGNCQAYNSIKIDICDFSSLSACILDYRPDYIIHCAAVSNPQKADALLQAEVFKANVLASELIAVEAAKIGARLVYTSTDLVYAGYRGSFLKEDAKLVPLSLYAETKLMGEVKIHLANPSAIVVRTPLLFGFCYPPSVNNFQEMVKKFCAGQSVNLFHNQYRTPLAVREAAAILVSLLELAPDGIIVNMAGPSRVSRVELGEMACEAGGFDKKLINSIAMEEIPSLVPVEDVSLNIDLLRSLGITLPSLDEMVYTEVQTIKNVVASGK
jgi:dTDP-4-dehydrorhamnose reductase